MASIPIPPQGTPYLNPTTGQVSVIWENYLLELQNAITLDSAPADAQYWVSTANSDLTNERNLGALTTGYVYSTVAAGVATPSIAAAIPGGDVTGAALTAANDTNVTLALGGNDSTALLRTASITAGWQGQLQLSRGGTGANLSATGGTSHVLQQASAGAAVTVGQLASTNLSDVVAASTYTPGTTGLTNLSTATASDAVYARVGQWIYVFGAATADVTSGSVLTSFTIGLPVGTTNAFTQQCVGHGTCGAQPIAAPLDPVVVRGFTATAGDHQATLQWFSTVTGSVEIWYEIAYRAT